MAENTIDTLEIEVESSAKSAINELKSLKTEMKGFGDVLKNVMGNFKGFADLEIDAKEKANLSHSVYGGEQAFVLAHKSLLAILDRI